MREAQTRNLEIWGSMLSQRRGMTTQELPTKEARRHE
jgi:hypothetical protein